MISCATTKSRDEETLTVTMKNNLYSSQDKFENILKTNDPVFLSLKKNTCINNWGKEVFALKKKLRTIKKTSEKVDVWFKLGNCYNYVKDTERVIYYYDLVQGSGTKDTKLLSIIYFNMGQIYELNGQNSLAYSYYENAYKNDDPSSLSLFKLAILELKQREFRLSIKYLNILYKRYPKSNLVNFLIGVNYFHLNEKSAVINKVLPRLDEKSVSKVLLAMALDLSEGMKKKSLEADLSNLEVVFSMHQEFKQYLLGRLGK
jgi:tetratricopeptide (TPR) repeat protein